MDAEESIAMNGMQPKDDEMKWNHKKRAKDRFLLFCETVLNHERELLSETLNSSQESISENLAPEGPHNNTSIENSTFNSDSDGANEAVEEGAGAGGGGGGDSFNSITCFCGKPFAGRPMIECSSCLTWLHMSCVKVKRKNIPEFYYCDKCKSSGLLSPSSNALGTSTASSGEESGTPVRSTNGTLSSNNMISPDGILYSTHQNQSSSSTTSTMTMISQMMTTTTTTGTGKPRKPKSVKKSSASSLMMNSSDNIKNNSNSDSKYLTKKSTNSSSTVNNNNGKLKKIRQSTKKMRTTSTSPSAATMTKAASSYSPGGLSSSLAAAASLTALSLNHHQFQPQQQVSPGLVPLHSNGFGSENSTNNLLKSPIATNNNNNIYTNNGSSEVMETILTTNENGSLSSSIDNGGGSSDKFNNKRLKLL